MWGVIRASFLGGVAAAGIHHVFTKPKPFHIQVEQPEHITVAGINIVPVIRKVMSILPDSTRKNFVSKSQASYYKDLRDRYDFTGESPYIVTELKSGKLWQVAYDMELDFLTDDKLYKEMTKLTGIDVTDEKFESKILAGAEIHGEVFKEAALRDAKTLENWVKKRKSPTIEDLKELPPFRLNMIVVKLDSGSLLLYAPVAIRPEVDFGEWLDALGKVEWVVVPSAAHTLNMKATVERYPSAKIIGPEAAEAKVKLVTKLPRENFDFLSTNADELKRVNAMLSGEGCEIYNVDGDTIHAVLVRCHNTILDNDLVYGHHDGEGFLSMNAQEFRQCKPENWYARIWKFCLINKPYSPNGFLPSYRFWLMDPNSLGAMTYEPPASDGSSCGIMANSLRKILNLEFESAVVRGGKMSREDFRKSVDSCWNWLDGKRLIE